MPMPQNKSIARNGTFYFFYNALNMAYPFIISVYAARVLLPSIIGTVAYIQNFALYFSTFAFLGIPTYGLREIAKFRNDKDQLNKVYSELFFINLISTLFFVVSYYSIVLHGTYFIENRLLYCLVGITIALNALNIGWLYEGLEEFAYITKRNTIVKLSVLILMFFLIKNNDDAVPYALLFIIGTTANNLINFIHSKKHVKLVLENLEIKKHLKPIFILVVVNIAIELYSLIDVTMLGYFDTKESVAFYSYATKINRMLIQFANTITIVLVPRLAFEYKSNVTEFNRLLTKGLKIILMSTIPVIVGIQYTAVFLTQQIYGVQYACTGELICLLSIILLIAPIGYLLGSRVMLVSNNEHKMMYCVGVGAIVNIIGNYYLIPSIHMYGAAISSIFSEFIVMALYILGAQRLFKLEKIFDFIIKILAATFFEYAFLHLSDISFNDSWAKLSLQIIGSSFIYIAVLYLAKENITRQYITSLLHRIRSFSKGA